MQIGSTSGIRTKRHIIAELEGLKRAKGHLANGLEDKLIDRIQEAPVENESELRAYAKSRPEEREVNLNPLRAKGLAMGAAFGSLLAVGAAVLASNPTVGGALALGTGMLVGLAAGEIKGSLARGDARRENEREISGRKSLDYALKHDYLPIPERLFSLHSLQEEWTIVDAGQEERGQEIKTLEAASEEASRKSPEAYCDNRREIISLEREQNHEMRELTKRTTYMLQSSSPGFFFPNSNRPSIRKNLDKHVRLLESIHGNAKAKAQVSTITGDLESEVFALKDKASSFSSPELHKAIEEAEFLLKRAQNTEAQLKAANLENNAHQIRERIASSDTSLENRLTSRLAANEVANLLA